MSDSDITRQNIDVYMTKEGPWNPDHGELAFPDDRELLPFGDAFVTRRVKAAGTYWIAWRRRSRKRRHRRRVGLWAPKASVEEACAQAAATEDERAIRGGG